MISDGFNNMSGSRRWGAGLAVLMVMVISCQPAVGQGYRSDRARSGAAGRSFVDIVAAVRPSVVAVGSYYYKDNPTVQYAGTGFIIHDGLTVVTNAHVVDAVKEKNRVPQLRVFFPDDQSVKGREATIIAEDPLHDVALLRIQGPRANSLTLNTQTIPPQGGDVAVVGYPIGLVLGLVPTVHKGIVAAVVPAVLPLPSGSKMTPQLAAAIRQPYDLYQLDLVVFPGNSGSPLIDVHNGTVVGIINKTLAAKTREHLLTNPSGIAYAVPTRWIQELLARAAADAQNEGSTTPLSPLGD